MTPPSGFRDYLPEDCARRAQAAEAIAKAYRSFGFSRIATSALEDLAVLTGKGGGENEKLIFKVLKRGEKLQEALSHETRGEDSLTDMGLRFDLTLPLARYYARHGGQLPKPFKAFHIGPVWRAERAQKGRYREFVQCDADIIGSDSPLCEVEVIRALSAALKALGVADAVVVLNDRAVLHGLLDQAGVAQDKRGPACVLLDKLDKMERPALLSELEALVGPQAAKFVESVVLAPEPDEARLRAAAPEAMARLYEIHKLLLGSGGRAKDFRLSPCLARGFDYYTGPVFEFRHPKLSGSLGGGGRYDRLTEKFGGPAVPACGASIGFERLMLLLEETAPAPASGPRACVTVFSLELRAQSLAAAARLREAGWDVDLYAGTGKLAAQFKYADQRRAGLALVIGPDEAAAGKVKIKDLASGAERLQTLEELLAGS